jgi:hypothetical protein
VRRIVLILVLVVIVGIAGFILLRPKRPGKAAAKPAAGDSTSTSTAPKAATPGAARKAGGKAAGNLKPMTPEQRRAEMKRARDEERARKKQLRLQERERRRALRSARSRRGKRKSGRRGQAFYVLKAVVSMGDESYALVDSRRVQVGDVLMGRRVVAIQPDRIEIEAFGKRTTVKVGESLLPPTFNTKRTR